MVPEDMRPAAVAVCALLLLLGPADARRRARGPQLLQVLTPAGRASAPAHPDVNIVVRFTASADPDTFRARLAGRDITELFKPMVEQRQQVGVRASVPRERLRLGQRRSNRLRVLVRAQKGTDRGRSARQILRLRFRAVEATNQPPVANIDPESEVIFPNVALGFDARQSFDPELDELSYRWDFGEGAPSSEMAPTHTYASADEPRTVTLTVSDGQTTGTATLALRSCPQPDGVAPGVVQVASDAPLEFGSVPPGASGTRTFAVKNIAADSTSRLAVCIGFEGPGFSVRPDRVELGSGESAPVTVTFAPGAVGHAAAIIALVSAAANRPLVSLVAHGYGGNAPGPGPTLGSSPLLYYASTPFEGVRGFFPSGAPFSLDNHVGSCAGFGGDACVTDADCAADGGGCPQSATCSSGERSGQVCTRASDCPYLPPATDECPAVLRYSCDSFSLPPLAPTEMCGDGAGGLYILAEDTFTDPNQPENDDELSGTLMRVTFDANGNTTGRTILARTTEDTLHLACDTFAPDAGGRVYITDTRSVPEVNVCFRDTREGLVAIRKNNGAAQTVMPRIDAAEGLSDCDDIDNSTHLEVSADGAQAFASFESGGLWRLRPSPLQFLDSSYFEDTFRLHPDGSVIFATARDGPTTTTVSVFKVTPAQVAAGPLPVAGLPPCATFQLPNNLPPGSSTRRRNIAGLAVSPPTAGSRDGTILVSVETSRLSNPSAPEERCAGLRQRIDNLNVHGTMAFSSPAETTTCTPVGLVNLETVEPLTLTF
jgi:PKD domain/Cep192 domain 4